MLTPDKKAFYVGGVAPAQPAEVAKLTDFERAATAFPDATDGEAYRQGQDANRFGLTREANPYPAELSTSGSWRRGFDDEANWFKQTAMSSERDDSTVTPLNSSVIVTNGPLSIARATPSQAPQGDVFETTYTARLEVAPADPYESIQTVGGIGPKEAFGFLSPPRNAFAPLPANESEMPDERDMYRSVRRQAWVDLGRNIKHGFKAIGRIVTGRPNVRRALAATLALTLAAGVAQAGTIGYDGRIANASDSQTYRIRNTDDEINLTLAAVDSFTPSVGIFYDDPNGPRRLVATRYGAGTIYAQGQEGFYDVVVTGNAAGRYSLGVNSEAEAASVPVSFRGSFDGSDESTQTDVYDLTLSGGSYRIDVRVLSGDLSLYVGFGDHYDPANYVAGQTSGRISYTVYDLPPGDPSQYFIIASADSGQKGTYRIDVTQVPEPAAVVGLGVVAWAALRRVRN